MANMFKLHASAYYPSNDYGWKKDYTEREARKEYARLRDIAQKRIKRLKEAEFEVPYGFSKGFATTKSLSIDKLSGALSDIRRFLEAESSTVKGARRKEIRMRKRLAESGYHIKNVRDFGRYMEEFRAYYGRYARGSEAAAELYETMERKGFEIDDVMANFDMYMENQKKIQKIIEDEDFTKKGGYISSERLRKLL